ncbi:hypothetical protein SAE02_72940 [Skermanella aerolata]|uniref:Uncharacterized protein n=1 Tax=Skermanella aerolata TaxID=393310 RepID=A0A512E376_9PROT|nr:hypothetical protein N826_36970 [Skermanella aerolata KACC 11604]GEO43146.1 hypothetical protein SAE02_72940 [Skermanella aerolata]
MGDGATFTSLLAAANESKTECNLGQWTPAACKTWHKADSEISCHHQPKRVDAPRFLLLTTA